MRNIYADPGHTCLVGRGIVLGHMLNRTMYHVQLEGNSNLVWVYSWQLG